MSGDENVAGEPVARVVRRIVESQDYQTILDQMAKAAERINRGDLQGPEITDLARKIDGLAGPELREAAAQPGLILQSEGTLTVGAPAIQALLQATSTLTVGPTGIPSVEAFGQPTVVLKAATDEAAIGVTETAAVQTTPTLTSGLPPLAVIMSLASAYYGIIWTLVPAPVPALVGALAYTIATLVLDYAIRNA